MSFKVIRIKNYSQDRFDGEKNLDKIVLRNKHFKESKASKLYNDEQLFKEAKTNVQTKTY